MSEFRKGAKIKNIHTGERRVIVCVEEVNVPPLLVYITDDGVRYNIKSLSCWELDE